MMIYNKILINKLLKIQKLNYKELMIKYKI